MTREVLVRISGLQAMEQDGGSVEVITAGDYFYKSGKHYIVYEETAENMGGSTRNLIQIAPGLLDVRKRGSVDAHMVFEPDKKSITHYATPMGDMVVGISTNELEIREEEHRIRVSVGYSLDINYEHMFDCRIRIDICSKEMADPSFCS